MFLDQVYPILRNLTFSIRSGNWELFIDVVRRAIPLFFGFGRTNYSRWVPLFLEDCLDLHRKMPELHRHFKKGGWVYYFTSRRCSAVGMDMGLEKVYNKPAKSIGGIIGMTSRKEAVAQWNVLKHEKDLHVAFMLSWTRWSESKDRDSELNLHHEFMSASSSNRRVKMLLDYLKLVGSPFVGDKQLRHLCNGSSLALNVVEGILRCLTVGESSYQEFKNQRLDEKSISLHATIPGNKKEVLPDPIFETAAPSKTLQARIVKSKQDSSDAHRYIEAARDRGYSMEEILKYETTSTSYFLVSETNEGHRLKKCDKAALAREVLTRANLSPQDASQVLSVDAVVFDFMALVRKVPIKKMELKTYGELASALQDLILNRTHTAARVDVVFDVYCRYSPKCGERTARGANSSAITVAIKKDAQNLPVNMELFWNSMDNKIALQKYFQQWMVKTYKGNKDIFFGGVEGSHCFRLTAGQEHECVELRSTQEEADERISFHVNHANENGYKKVLIVSPDTDVFVCLLYHLQETWELEELFMRIGSGKSTKTVPLHSVVKNLNASLVKHLPSIHALTGCDTTSKVGGKVSCFTKSLNLELLEGFGSDSLSEEMLDGAEQFLLATLTKARDVKSFDDYRYEQYHDMKALGFGKLVCCSPTIREHIKRADHQALRWKKSAQPPESYPDPAAGFGYNAIEGELIPIIIPRDTRPPELPEPCKCTNCTKITCRCRTANLKCCSFCNCGKECKNPI